MPPESSDDDRKSALRSQINENLRRVYDTALEEEVPERFTLLLQQLRGTAASNAGTRDSQASAVSDGSGTGESGTGQESRE